MSDTKNTEEKILSASDHKPLYVEVTPNCAAPTNYGNGTKGKGRLVPEIEALGLPHIGNAAFAVRGSLFVGAAPVTQIVGFAQTSLLVAGIELLVDPFGTLIFASALASGAPEFP